MGLQLSFQVREKWSEVLKKFWRVAPHSRDVTVNHILDGRKFVLGENPASQLEDVLVNQRPPRLHRVAVPTMADLSSTIERGFAQSGSPRTLSDRQVESENLFNL